MGQFPERAFPSFPPPRLGVTSVGLPPVSTNYNVEPRRLIVGRGVSLEGSVTDAEQLIIEGSVQSAHITAVELTIAEGGLFRGSVQVERASVFGTFVGDLSATGELLVCHSGHLTGTARYGRLVVEDGGTILGVLEPCG